MKEEKGKPTRKISEEATTVYDVLKKGADSIFSILP